MQYKNSKKISFTAGSVKKEFSSEQLTSYSGLSVTSDFINHCGIYRRLEHLFPTTRHNASRFSTAQILSSRSEERRVGKECRSRWSPEH